MTELVFLGSGGGRFMLTTQVMATGGFRINTENFKIHVDPGAGALVRSIQHRQNPQKLNCIIVTHAHPDHATDTAPLIEAMCKGMTRERGTLIISESVISGKAGVGPVMGNYHYLKPKKSITAKAGEIIEIEENAEKLVIETVKCLHSDESTFGIKLKFSNMAIGYTSDTDYFGELQKLYAGCDILIMNATRPDGERIKHHLCIDDAVKILNTAKPKLAILSHIGMKFWRAGISGEVEKLENATGVKVIAAEDGMKIDIEETLNKISQSSLNKFA
ncbi:MAG: MBL fold metallo-hydrolase [Candidatus Aenigmarchaeota archaeon]|nr:MBL fold metallo-hydrolase [Candidatus Aenigmarchaeota archaeon]